jgi:hypothetical protein
MSLSDPILEIIEKYKNHPSISNIKSSAKVSSSLHSFTFRKVSIAEVQKVILSLDEKKSVGGEIPLWLLKENLELSSYICTLLNEFFDTGIFPDTQKLANITPVFKKGNPFLKENYRPISILPLLSKILERVLHTQISDYMEAYLNPILCGFRKKTQHPACSFKITEFVAKIPR